MKKWYRWLMATILLAMASGQAMAGCWANSPLSWTGLATATFEWLSPDCSQGEFTLTADAQSPVAVQGIVATGIIGFEFEADKSNGVSTFAGPYIALAQRDNSLTQGEVWKIGVHVDPMLSMGGAVTQQGSWSLMTTTLAPPPSGGVVTAVPEPSIYALMATCLLVVVLFRKQHNKQNQPARLSVV